MKHERLLKIGLGIGIASAVVGVIMYKVLTDTHVNTIHHHDSILGNLEDKVEHIICTIKK